VHGALAKSGTGGRIQFDALNFVLRKEL